jgi:hypothetical protein
MDDTSFGRKDITDKKQYFQFLGSELKPDQSGSLASVAGESAKSILKNFLVSYGGNLEKYDQFKNSLNDGIQRYKEARQDEAILPEDIELLAIELLVPSE